MTGPAHPGDRRRPGLSALLFAAVVAVACGPCVVRAVQTVGALRDLFPATGDRYGADHGWPEAGPPGPCVPTDPDFVAEFSRDPVITTVPPGAMLRLPRVLANCAGDGGGVASTVEGAPTATPEPVTAHYRALLVAGGWVLSDPPAQGPLVCATRAWRDRTAAFALWLHGETFLAEITIVPTQGVTGGGCSSPVIVAS